jgi:hypothetical protein
MKVTLLAEKYHEEDLTLRQGSKTYNRIKPKRGI